MFLLGSYFLLTMSFWISAAFIATIAPRLRYKSYPLKTSIIRCLCTFFNSLKPRIHKLLSLISLTRSDFLFENNGFFFFKYFSWKNLAEQFRQVTSLTALNFVLTFYHNFDCSPSRPTSSDQYFDLFSLYSWRST